MAKMHPARHLIGRFLAAGLLAAHLLVVAMALSPALHHWLHRDADESDHQCAVTAMIDGQFDRPDAAGPDVIQPLFFAKTCVQPEPSQPLADFSLASPGERAPPRA